MTIKVCHVLSGDLWAGAESMGYNLIKGLESPGNVDVSAIVLNQGELLDRLCKCGVRVHLIDESRYAFHELVVNAAKVLAEFAPDVIHAHRYKENLIAFLATRFCRRAIHLVTTLHGLPERRECEGFKEKLKNAIDTVVVGRFFDVVAAVSDDIRRVVRKERSISAARVEVIRNGIDFYEHSRAEDFRETVLIGSAGRLFPVKDYAFMVEIAREVAAQERTVRFALAGEGPQMDELRSLVEHYGLNSVFEFRGFIADLTSFYSESDIFLNTSKHEGIPMSVLEAMSSGVPIIAPAVGGLPEIIRDGIDGFLIRERSAAAFAERCIELARNPRLRKEIGKAAANRVRTEFSTERMVRDYSDLYSRVMRNSGVRPIRSQTVRATKRFIRRVVWHVAGLGVENPCVPSRTTKVTFVCKGNICRSVFAHYLAKKWAQDRALADIDFDSGGLEVSAAIAPPENARIAAKRFGVSIDDSRSKPVSVEHSRKGEIFVVMEPGQLRMLRNANPNKRDQFFLLPRFLSPDHPSAIAKSRSCVLDPYGRDLETFYECYEHIEACVEDMLDDLGLGHLSTGG